MSRLTRFLTAITFVALLASGCVSPEVPANGTETPVTGTILPISSSPPPTMVQLTPAATSPPSPTTTTPPSPTPTIPVGVQIGNRAPNFQLQDLAGETVSLEALRGQPVLINFWATWCGPCKIEMPYLQQIYDGHSARGLRLYAIDVGESATTAGKYLAENNLSMPVLLDTDRKVAAAYGITAIPTTFFIDLNGIVRQKFIGAFPNKEAIESQLSKILP
jgi:peroxiredoxin